jgi:DNA end-binding protein Ku
MRPTGHRIKYSKVDAEPGRRWDQRGYRQGLQGRHRHLQEVTKDELENVALESTRTIEIDEFAKRDEIDSRYIIRPYYLAPEGKVGHGDPRNDPQHGHGRHRAPRADEP